MQRKIFALLLCLVALVCLLSACGAGNTDSTTISPTAHKVTLETDDHFTVKGSKEVYVEDGETAVFSVTPKSGYTIAYLSSGVYNPEEGKLYVYNVTSDKVIAMKSKLDGFCVTFEGEHFTIEEGTTHYVSPGSTIGVTLVLEEGYEVVDVIGGTYNPETNSIMVQDVQGDVTVSIETAKKANQCAITFKGEHFEIEQGSKIFVNLGSTIGVTLILEEGYEVVSISGGMYNPETNSIVVQNVQADVTVSIETAKKQDPPPVQYTVTFKGEHFEIEQGREHFVTPGSALEVILILEEGYVFVSISGGTYNPETNSIVVQNVQGNITVSIVTAEKAAPPPEQCTITFMGNHFEIEGGREYVVSYGSTLEVVLTFEKWYEYWTITGGEYIAATNSVIVRNVQSDITVHIHTSYVRNTYSVVFMGVNGIPTQFVLDGELVTKPADPSKEHYSFDGWYTEAGKKWNFAQDTVTGNLMLTAKFNPKTYSITYDLGGVNADNTNPASYTYSSTTELHFAPLFDPDGEKVFIGWSKPCVEAGEVGDITVTAKWVDAENLIGKYGFEANTFDGHHCYIHYAEKGGSSEDKSTWYKAPTGIPQYYESIMGTGGAAYYIQSTWNDVLFFGSAADGPVFTGWKGSHALPVIVEGKGGDGSNVNFYLSTTIGNKVNTGFQSFATTGGVAEKYLVAGLFDFYGGSLSDKVALSIDFRMNGTGAFPIHFYVRNANNQAYAHGADRFTLLYVDGRGNVVIGEDTFQANRMQYVGVSKTTIGNVGDGNWHNFKFEFIRTGTGFNVNIYIDDMKAGNTLAIYTTDAFFTAENNPLNQLFVYGGAVQGNTLVDELVAASGKDVECTYDLDNFVAYIHNNR